MRKSALIIASMVFTFVQAGCTTAGAPPTPPRSAPATEAAVEQARVLAPTATPTATAVPPTEVPKEVAFPLSAPGALAVGVRSYDYEAMGIEGRAGGFTVWYPAFPPDDAPEGIPAQSAPVDASVAPYPLLLASSKLGGHLGSHLASHGFVFVGLHRQDSEDAWGPWLIDFPRDLLLALDIVADHPLEGLEGMIDAKNAGVLGYSFGGFDALAVSGARIDPDYYLAQCATAADRDPPLEEWWIAYICALTADWDAFVEHAGVELTESEDGLWQPMTDARIRAVMPMVPEGAWLFGERGLAAVDRPVLLIGATRDRLNYYDLEAVPIFEWSAGPDRQMISFVNSTHMIIFSEKPRGRLKHFAVAFFGYHLQGRDEYRSLFSEEFVAQSDDLAWGVYRDED